MVALPLAMAFSIASGLTPQAGIYCAIVTGFLVSALGGSKTQIGGPTGTFVVVDHCCIHEGEFAEIIGKENICGNVQEALRRAEEVFEGLGAKAMSPKS